MGAIVDFWKSERGLLAVVIIISATVLAAMAVMTVDQWTSFVQFIFATYVAGKTATGVAEIVKGKPTTDPAQPAPGAAS